MRRALGYLYARETRSSFLIEREEPGPTRAERFIASLRAAGQGRAAEALSEARLVGLQNGIVDPRYAQTAFRTEQNYVAELLPGLAERVHYVGPPPAAVRPLMEGLAECSERLEAAAPLAQAAVTAFQFVFVHPFEDGNGRLHRFLLHDVLARRGVLPEGHLLPLSAVMLEDLRAYDRALESFSRPLLGRLRYELGDAGGLTVLNPERVQGAWRFPDLSRQVAYVCELMARALEVLPSELRFLRQYDAACVAVANVVDMPDRRRRLLLSLLHQNRGRLARAKRELFSELRDEELAAIEEAYGQAFAGGAVGEDATLLAGSLASYW